MPNVNGRLVGGVLGGLGPLATVQFLQAVIDATEVEVEQEYPDLVVTQRSSTPDRTAAILGTGPSPGPQMAADAARLEKAGAHFVVIPCNTASMFIDEVAAAVRIPVLSIVEETVAAVRERAPEARRVGLMATDGTLRSGIYHHELDRYGLTPVEPDETLQRRVMAMIYDGVKRGLPVPESEYRQCVHALEDLGAQAVISGCTEISVLYARFGDCGGVVVDSLDALARTTVARCGARVRSSS